MSSILTRGVKSSPAAVGAIAEKASVLRPGSLLCGRNGGHHVRGRSISVVQDWSGRLSIRWMIRRDMEEVLRIEAASFDEPWAR